MSQNAPAIVIRPMLAADLAAAHALSAAVGWPHRPDDWALMLSLGEGVVAERDGAIAGTALAWRYGDDAATVGMIIVAEALQGRGMGRRLLQSLLDQLEPRTVRLNATPEGLRLYHTLGFRADGMVTQFQINRLPACQVPVAHITPLASADLPWMTALDRHANGMDRASLLAGLLENGHGIARDRTAFALTRRFGRGHLVGPVVAPDEATAQILVAHLLSSLEGRFVRVDTANGSFGGWLLEQGLLAVDTGTRMVNGSASTTLTSTAYALASQAYG